MDLQLRDQKVSDLEEMIFHNGVTMERRLQECREDLANAQLPAKGQISESAYQEHVKGTERALEDLRSQLTTYDKRFHEGERQMRRLREKVKTMQQSQMNDARMYPEVNSRFEGELRKQQQRYDRMREDSVEDAKAINSYLDQAHEMVTDLHRRQDSSSSTSAQKRPSTLSMVARKGDMKVEVRTPEVCRVGEIVEAETVVDKESLVFRFPLERSHPEGQLCAH